MFRLALTMLLTGLLSVQAQASESENNPEPNPPVVLKARGIAPTLPAWVLKPTTSLLHAERPIMAQLGGGGDAGEIGFVGGIIGGILDIALTQVVYRTAPGWVGQEKAPGWKAAGTTVAVSSFAIPAVSAVFTGEGYLGALLCGVIVKGISGLLALPFLADPDTRTGGAVILTLGSIVSIPAYMLGGIFTSGKIGG